MIQHLSIRIPWHDNCWNGTVCKHPELNQDCRVLRAVAKDKKDSVERECAGQVFCTKNDYMPPCLRECGAFMSCNSIEALPIEHPYTYDEKYKHISDTKYHINAFSFIARPYAWVLRENAKKTIDDKLYYTGYDDSIEVDVGSRAWVSNGINQKKIFDYFYRDVKAGASIAVAYAKSIPFVEAAGRIVLGIGMVEGIEEIKQYDYNRELDDSDIRSYLWERQIKHSIRSDRANGFLFPVDEIQKYLYDHPEQSPDELIVIAPNGYFDEFSYATEHLSCDALILVLNNTITVLNKYKQIGLSFGNGKDWDYCIQWCKDKLNTIWKERGNYPGLGTVLRAAGLGYGNDIAYNMRERFKDEELWDKIPEVLANIKDYLPQDISDTVIRNIGKNNFNACYKIKKDVLELLSRISLSLDQAKIIIDSESICRGEAKYTEYLSELSSLEDKDICQNPYLLYEQTRLFEEKYRLGIGQIDIAMFKPYGDDFIFDSSDDERRIRAIAVSVLENGAQQGNTLLTADELISKVNNFRSDIELELDISKFTLKAFNDFFNSEFINVPISIQDDKKAEAYQLTRLADTDKIIREFVDARVSESIVINDNWEELLSFALGNSQNTEREELSRSEKLNAVQVIAQSKISVLTGGAGTGKTSTLVALCLSKEINKSGILVLAPTGKARVVLESKLNEKKIKYEANTVFGYLLKSAHCDPFTYRYYLSGKHDDTLKGKTVIIDESSMLTEEMFGALAETIALAKRVVFVGDPNQLPPIGAGKPFYELVEYLRKNYPTRIAELKISNRQKSEEDVRIDVEFARMFTLDRAREVSDDVFESIANDKKYIEFVKYGENFSDVLLTTLKEALEMKSVDDVQKFDESLGGTLNGKYMNFAEKSTKKVDEWQIMSPYRNDAQTGTETLNRIIHQKYRLDNIAGAPLKQITHNPLGRDGILLGEKVINLHNKELSGYPNSPNCLNYVANGEIGLVERIWEKPKAQRNTHQVRFTSQQNCCYNYDSLIDSENPDLELAYALTVHKAQGSGFATTILIINEPENGANAFISREMIYTALTRHTKKIYILYNKEPEELKKYADPTRSELARRLTNLFGKPSVFKTEEGYYAEHLIHITSYGEKVRSKSEVIIANELYAAGISFKYEQKLILPDGKSLLPDFTISLDGKEVIWEHLGMLSDPDYRRRWEEKKEKYLQCGISEANKNLIITSDKPNGGIDSCTIAEIISQMR